MSEFNVKVMRNFVYKKKQISSFYGNSELIKKYYI